MIVDDPDDGGSDSTSNRLLALIGSGIISGDLAPGEKLTEVGKVESPPRMEGKQMAALVAPKTPH